MYLNIAAFKILILSVLLLAAWGEKQGQKILSCPMHQLWALASQPIELEKHHDDALCCSAYGSVSAGREIWLFRVIFFQKVEPLCDQT